ncbi:DUF397 domain-containing protein [Streptomyces candidus]|uniref:DUF397 domain-containing protein n=1 Tax=Streptomyces candidus TaxID=67283 RepID=A0A7X0HJJ3_9ACTN|nr:DUF397 domain-containing protein [Streptomyces candidus]MBB6437524.1 hypothetical protein [Streptomyces candidus]GHH54445.1 hypothetical protein GCM10018773_57500 [Streptomyces candidus]
MSNQQIVTPFVKSTHSGGGSANECVEVAHTADGGRAVRDTKDRNRGTQFHHLAAWSDFLTAVKTDTLR